MAYTYYIQTGIQTYNSATDTWVITSGTKITASTTKSIFYYSLDEDTAEILGKVESISVEQAKSNRVPRVRYNINVDKVLGKLTDAEPYLIVYVDYLQQFIIDYYYKDDSGNLVKDQDSGIKLVDQGYTIRNTSRLKEESYSIYTSINGNQTFQKKYYYRPIAKWVSQTNSESVYSAGDLYNGNEDLSLILDNESSYILQGNYIDDIPNPSREPDKVENAILVKLYPQGGDLSSTSDLKYIHGYKSYHFLGWTDTVGGTVLPDGYQLSKLSNDGDSLILYPVWQESPCQRALLSAQSDLSKPAEPTRAGYRFQIWSARSQEEYLPILQDNTTGIDSPEPIPIFALWQSELEYANEYEQTIRKVPYKIEVWEDQFNEDNNRWEEIRLVTLGADTMEDQGRAFNIKFKQTIYGELTLTFSLYGTYIDNQTDQRVENYLIPYCFNEAKIKLQYDGEWYDFIIKDIQETHNQQFTKTYTCQYLPIYELSKIGYTQVFSLDNRDGSGIQSAPEFMEGILENTEWRYVQAGSDKVSAVKDLEVSLTETSEEIVYEATIKEAINYRTYSIDEYGTLHLGTGGAVSSGKVYIPYSQLNKEGTIFGCFSNGLIEVDGDLILQQSLVTFELDWSKYPITDFTITQFAAEVPKKSNVSEWIEASVKENGNVIDTISQYCNKGSSTKYSPVYYRVKTATTDTAMTYSATQDKKPCYFGTIDSMTYGSEKTKLASLGTNTVFAFTNEDNFYTFKLNQLSGASELPLGTEYRYYFTGNTNNSMVAIIGEVNSSITSAQWATTTATTVTVNGKKTYILPLTGFTASDSRFTSEKVSTAVFLGASPKTYYQKSGSAGDEYYRSYTDLAIPDSANFPSGFYEASINTESLSSNSSQVHSIRQYFTLSGDTATVVGTAPSNETEYFYIKDANGLYYYDTTNLNYTLIAPPTWKNGGDRYTCIAFTPQESYIMYRSLESSNSNCFDLTQKVAETFEVWCKYIIEHNDDGSIAYDDTDSSTLEPRRKKWVTLTSYAGEENPVGFTYGINLTNLSRTIKTDSLVTKLYVDHSENNYTSDGYVAISSAEDNISKENVLYNFDYFIQVGLLEKMQVYNDFYKIESEAVAAQDPLEMKCVIEANGKNGPGYLRLLGLLNAQYDKISEQINGETGYSYQVIHLKEMLSAYSYASAFTVNANIAGQDTAPSIGTSTAEDQATLQRLTKEYNRVSAQLAAAKKQLTKIVTRKQELERKFNQRYARYIQEGNWTSSDYIDSDSYYADALKVSNDGAKPNVNYNFTAIDLYALPEYKDYKFRIGDRTWVEDTEYFGYEEDGTPYHESVILTEINYDLDNAAASTFAVQNYSNKFDDLFQTLSATANSFSLNQQMYGRASKLLTSGGLNDETTQKSLTSNKELTLMSSSSIQFDNDGIIFTNVANPNQILRIGSDGISMSNNGGASYDQRLMW